MTNSHKSRSAWRGLDWWLLSPALALLSISVIILRSLPIDKSANLQLWHMQLIAIGAGLVVMVVLSRVAPDPWYRNSRWLYLVTAILLVLVLVLGESIAGAKRWLSVGGIFDLQVIELAKFTVVILLARYLSQVGRHDGWRVFGALVYGGIIIALVLLEPDLDNAILLASLVAVMLIASGVAKRYIILLACITLIMIPITLSRLHSYQRQRLTSFANPSQDAAGANYNINQAKIAIGSGGFWGEGIGGGSQSDLKFLPAESTDFIFSVVAEKLGFIGATFVILCLCLIVVRIWWLALVRSENLFMRLSLIGFGWMLGVEIIINIGMNLGLLPVSGIQLPFVSYGGTHVVVELATIGIIMALSRHNSKITTEDTLQTAVRLLP